MFTTTFTAISSFQMIFFSKNDVPFRTQIIIFFGQIFLPGKTAEIFAHDVKVTV